MIIHVGYLSCNNSEYSIKEAFKAFGTVDTARVRTARVADHSKGFGFAEMASAKKVRQAIDRPDGSDMNGRNIKVNETRPKNGDGNSCERNRF